MAAELARVRTKFVDGVSSAVIDDLLDDLLEDRILSDAEKDSILQENNSTRNKARQLIDTVKKKGDDASWKMIAHLLNRDPTLHKNLALSSGQHL
ncbi:caspase-1-A-like isoform 1-T1 [Aulostomus maculatus]